MPASPVFNLHPTANQLWRIQNHHIKLSPVPQHLPHITENISLHKTHSSLIQIRILTGHLQRLLIQIHPDHFRRLPQYLRLNRKTARVTAQIQHRFPGTKLRQSTPILTLIAEKTRLVTTIKPHAKSRPILLYDHIPRTTLRLQLRGITTLLRQKLRTRSQQPVLRTRDLRQHRQQQRTTLIHPQGKCLRRQHPRKIVHHQPRQTVRLSMHNSPRRSLCRQFQCLRPQRHSPCQLAPPRIITRQLRTMPQQTHTQLAPRIVQTISERLCPLLSIHRHQISSLRTTTVLQPTTIHQRMQTPTFHPHHRNRIRRSRPQPGPLPHQLPARLTASMHNIRPCTLARMLRLRR